VGWGPGILANLHVTRLLAVGSGSYADERLGVRNGEGWIWRERRMDCNLLVPMYGGVEVVETRYGGMDEVEFSSLIEPSAVDTSDADRWLWVKVPRTLHDPSRGWTELSANVHLVLLGADVGVDPAQIVDFLFGWVGVDVMNDDDAE
jgi:hypothetical protein